MQNKHRIGFSLLELLIVIAVIAFLSAISVPSFFKFLAKSKRSEAYMTLRSLYMAEKAYWAERGTYTTVLQGTDGLGWKPEGEMHYTYGFPGTEGVNYFTGILKGPASSLQGARATDKEFRVFAVADIDGDGDVDVISIDQQGKIRIEKDDLA